MAFLDQTQKDKLEIEIGETEVTAKDFATSYSPVKRYILLAILILIIPIYFIAKYTVGNVYYSSWLKKAPYVHPASVIQLPVKVLDSGVLAMDGTNYSAYALVKNQNTDLINANLQYSFHFIDNTGAEIRSVEGNTFINAGEQKYVIVPRIILNTRPDHLVVNVGADPTSWSKRINLPNVILSSSPPNYADDANGFFIEGSVKNNSSYTLKTVNVDGVVFDADSKIIAVTQITMNTLTSQENRNFHMSWPLPLKNATSYVKIYTETNIFDQSNLQFK